MKPIVLTPYFLTFFTLLLSAISLPLLAASSQAEVHRKAVITHWTPDRIGKAIPRELRIDRFGHGFIRDNQGNWVPYGQSKIPMAKPVPGDQDIIEPVISAMDPAPGQVIGSQYQFTALITDASGIKTVQFEVSKNGGLVQSFQATAAGNDIWKVSLSGFTDGNWQWQVVAKDTASKGGNTANSGWVNFVVESGQTGGSDGEVPDDVITSSVWNLGGAVQSAAGRIYFEMPGNAKRKGPWTGYVCSGTVIKEITTDRSTVITAAHCVYDDANKAFARNVLFIPDQAGTTGNGTDTVCTNDPLGCWVADFGVVEQQWAQNRFPNNIPWDFAYYIFNNNGAHQGPENVNAAMDLAVSPLPVSFVLPFADDEQAGLDTPDYTHALGYSYSEDPNFMYCAEGMKQLDDANWWLGWCDLSGGSSGGPWVQPMDEPNLETNTGTGSGPIISVNSWGYTGESGMAGPKLVGTEAECLLNVSQSEAFINDAPNGDAGIVWSCP